MFAMTAWLLGASAVACTVAALVLLYRSWSRTLSGSRATVLTAWTLLLVASACWVALGGWEFGTIYAITVPSVAALPLLWLVADRRTGRVVATPRRRLSKPSWTGIAKHLRTFLLVVVLGILASTLITSAVGLLLPFGEINQLVFIVCVMPTVWGLIAFWLAMDADRRRPVLSLVALSAISLVAILIR